MSAPSDDLTTFEAHRSHLLALAYRMLGDMGRAEDLIQEGWLRWSARERAPIESPRAYLATLVTRLCLNELASARARREESRSDRLPEPVDLTPAGLDRLDTLERISMAFLVALQRLTPAERAALLLHDVFDFDHTEIAELIGKTPAACRKLLERAKRSVAAERRWLSVPREAHQRLLDAFVRAAEEGNVEAIVSLLAEDATLIADGGAEGRVVGGLRNLAEPLRGARHVAAFITTTAKRRGLALEREVRDINGQPALVLRDPSGPFAVITLAVDETRIHRVYFHGDLARLGHIGSRDPS